MKLTESPWLDDANLPKIEETPEEVFWVCSRKVFSEIKANPSISYLGMFPTESEAIKAARERTEWGEWDGLSAMPVTLSERLAQAKSGGFLGVKLTTWKNDKWVAIRTWAANNPFRQ